MTQEWHIGNQGSGRSLNSDATGVAYREPGITDEHWGVGILHLASSMLQPRRVGRLRLPGKTVKRSASNF
jgi:hypothetical protein